MGFPKGTDVVDASFFVVLFFPNQPDYIFLKKERNLVIQNIQLRYKVQTTRGIVHMEESHTKISRHDIKIIQKYQFFSNKN